MSNALTHTDIVRALRSAEVCFDSEATLVQLRLLYDQCIVNGVIPEEGQKLEEQQSYELQQPEERQPEQQQSEVRQPEQQQPEVRQPEQQQPEQQQPGEQQMRQQQPMGHLQWQAALTPQVQQPEVRQPVEDMDALDRQLEFAQKKRELMRLQQELQEMESRRIDLGILDAMVSKFDGSDAHDIGKWLDDLENVFQAFRYSERDKLVAARHLLSGYAKRFADLVRAHTYGELKGALLAEFKRAFSVQDVLRQLRARVLKPNETPRQYIVEMQYIASRANISEVDLIDLIIDGLNDKTSLVSMLYSATTVIELKGLMERYEKKRRVPVAASAKVAASTNGPKPKSGELMGTGMRSSDANAVRCYNCFAYGHYQSACTAPRRIPNSCFICGEVGHMRHSCPKKRTTGSAAAAVAAVHSDADEQEEELALRLSHTNLSN